MYRLSCTLLHLTPRHTYVQLLASEPVNEHLLALHCRVLYCSAQATNPTAGKMVVTPCLAPKVLLASRTYHTRMSLPIHSPKLPLH